MVRSSVEAGGRLAGGLVGGCRGSRASRGGREESGLEPLCGLGCAWFVDSDLSDEKQERRARKLLPETETSAVCSILYEKQNGRNQSQNNQILTATVHSSHYEYCVYL